MEDWKQRLYDNYASTGHASVRVRRGDGHRVSNYPFAARLIRRHLPAVKDIAVVDLACGDGALLACLKQLGYLNVAGVDASPVRVRAAHAAGLGEVSCQEIGEYLRGREQQFDAVFLMDVLEHLDRKAQLEVLDQVHRALKVGGILILHVPNAEGVFGMRVRYGDLTHENAFTPQSIRQALHVCGFRDIACHEDRPVVHGPTSLFRHVLWVCLTAPIRVLLSAETGATGHVLSQNMTVAARKRQTGAG